MQASIYNKEGKTEGTINLPEEVFGLAWNGDLVSQVVHSMRMNQRTHVQHVKDRSEVSGGGKKPWRQKGTGRARHGSRRSPIWRHGGATFGPRNERNFDRKINRKVKTKATNIVLSAKLGDGELVFVESLGLTAPKTKDANSLLKNLSKISGFEKMSYEKGKRVLVLTPEKNDNVIKSFSNIPTAHVEEIRNLNPMLALTYKYVVILDPHESLDVYISRNKVEERDAKVKKGASRSQVASIA